MRPLNHTNKTHLMNTVFDNVYQKGLENLNTEPFKCTSKPVHRAPAVIGGFTDENGVYQYCLEESGHTIPQEKYDSMWHPVRTAVLKKGTKGDNTDKTKVK